MFQKISTVQLKGINFEAIHLQQGNHTLQFQAARNPHIYTRCYDCTFENYPYLFDANSV
jgi:hypothetical protein